MKLNRKNIRGILQLIHREIYRHRMAHSVPFADARVSISEVVRSDLVQSDQNVVVRMLRNEIARSGRSVKHDRGQIPAVSGTDVIDERIELMFHFFYQLPPDPPPPKSPPPPKPPQPPLLPPPQSLEPP